MKYFEGTKDEYLEEARKFKSKNNTLNGFTEQLGFFKDSDNRTFKIRVKEGGRLRLASTESYGRYQTKRSKAEKPKVPEEAEQLRTLKSQAKTESESTLHRYASGNKPSIAEHDVRLASGGSNEYMSISDPEFKVFKDTVEAKAYSKFGDKVTVDIDDISGDVRVIPSVVHNKFEPTSMQPGIDIPMGSNIDESLTGLETLLQKPVSKLKAAGGSIRLNTKNLAIAGLLSYGALGTAASAAETTQRSQMAAETGNPLDTLQAGIAGVSSAADIAAYNPIISPGAELVSSVADIANIGIDVARSPEGQQAMQKWAEDPLNELEYWGKRGLKTLGGAMHYFKLA